MPNTEITKTIQSNLSDTVPFSAQLNGVCTLPQWGLLLVSGEDAIPFLHGQLTNDIKLLQENSACLAGYCTPKGRLLTSMLAWKSAQQIYLQLPVALLPGFQKRLQMFIMRSKVTLQEQTGICSAIGIIGKTASAQLTDWFPVLPEAPYTSVSTAAGTLLRLADALTMPRYQWIAGTEQASLHWPVVFSRLNTLPSAAWDWTEIQAGIPHISIATQEKFVPQMINYELIGAVNFKKGCYPGQEIVARTHYLGKQKRRMALGQIAGSGAQSGMEVFAAGEPEQACGMIVNAQSNGAHASDCLIEIKTMYLAGPHTIQLASGEAVRWLPMPYPLPVPAESD